ncbi:MAG: stage II sporulation protein P [Lachnospiraceae bacterium]|nr:stage II sporulation protein P [Lachnospiraceae bacterium]
MRGKIFKQKVRRWGAGALLAACVAGSVIFAVGNRDVVSWKQENNLISAFFKRQMERAYFQIPSFLEEEKGETDIAEGFLTTWMQNQLPLFQYVKQEAGIEPAPEDTMMAERILQKEGVDEDYKNIDEENLDYGKDALHIENSVLIEMERENSLHNTELEQALGEENRQAQKNADSEGDVSKPFQTAVYPAYTYDWSEEWNYENLISNFYAVDSSTSLKEEYMDLDRLLHQDLAVDKDTEGPQILIYHTHSREGFIDSVEGDSSTTIVGAGDKLTSLLQDKYGFKVLHHTGQYDAVREDAYANSLPEIEKILDENPSIEVVIDLHRDAVSGDRKLVMDLQGRPTARFMFFNGLSYIRKSGSIDYLENPYIQDNLAFSFQAQVAANEYYPGIARKVYLKAYRYNLHLKPKSILIELGAQNNTVEEIMNACDPLAHILAIVLNGMV